MTCPRVPMQPPPASRTGRRSPHLHPPLTPCLRCIRPGRWPRQRVLLQVRGWLDGPDLHGQVSPGAQGLTVPRPGPCNLTLVCPAPVGCRGPCCLHLQHPQARNPTPAPPSPNPFHPPRRYETCPGNDIVCYNGGSCYQSGADEYSCKCTENWTDPMCKTARLSCNTTGLVCMNGGICMDDKMGPYCQ